MTYLKNTLFLAFFLVGFTTSAQKFKSSESKVYFFSSAPIEDIEATNKKSTALVDLSTGDIVIYSAQVGPWK